jgi:chemotaxis protein CheC
MNNISELQLDALKEIINIGIGKSASSLNQVLGKKIKLQVPTVEVLSNAEIKSKVKSDIGGLLSIVKMPFRGDVSGVSELIFPIDGSKKIVSLIAEEVQFEEGLHDNLKVNVLTEIGNMILNALIGTIANLLGTRMRYSIPKYEECYPGDIGDNVSIESHNVIYAETLFSITKENITGSFLLFLEIGSFEKLLKLLNR